MKEYYLTLCAVVRDEELYLEDWINFHFKQGVERFYIYDNSRHDRVFRKLEEAFGFFYLPGSKEWGIWLDRPSIVENELITYIRWDHLNPCQKQAYNHYGYTFGHLAHWCAFIDADEYLYSPVTSVYGKKTVSGLLRDVYDINGVSALAARWYLYGSNGHQDYSPEAVTARFTRREDKVDKHCKSIVRMSEFVQNDKDPHYFDVLGAAINEKFEPLPQIYSVMEGQPAEIIRVNHYVTKSKNEYYKRRGELPCASSAVMKDPVVMFEAHDKNDVEDLSILEWV